MNILAIRLARLGDLILLLPALESLKRSVAGSRLTLLTGSPCAPLAELCPAIDEVIAVDRLALRDGPGLSAAADIFKLLRDIHSRRFDIVIDFHSFRETNLICLFSQAPRRLALKRFNESYLSFCFNEPPVLEDKSLHVSAMFMRVVERFGSPGPTDQSVLVIPESVRSWVWKHLASGPHIAFYVDAPIPERVWPPERFAAVADYVVQNWNMDTLILSGSDGEKLVEQVLRASRFPGRLRPFSRLTLPQLAGVIASSRLLVSNDTGPMHIGPALAVPTIGLFSVGLPEHFKPTGENDRFIRANPIERISTEDVIQAMEGLRVYS